MPPGDAHCGKEVEIWTEGIRGEGFMAFCIQNTKVAWEGGS